MAGEKDNLGNDIHIPASGVRQTTFETVSGGDTTDLDADENNTPTYDGNFGTIQNF